MSRLPRSARFAVLLTGLVVVATACPPQPPQTGPYPLVPEDPAVSLEEMVGTHTASMDTFDTGLGIMDAARTAGLNDPSAIRFDDLNHAMASTAFVAAAMGHRYAATGDPGALAVARRAWNGMHAAANISRQSANVLPSLADRPVLARWVGPETPGSDGFFDRWPGGCFYAPAQCPVETATPWGDVKWISSVSKDMVTYWFFGASALHATVDDPAMRTEIATDVEDLADGLIDSSFILVDPTNGELTNAPLVIGPARLAVLAIAHEVTGEQRFRDAYLNDSGTWANLGLLSDAALNRYRETFGLPLLEMPYYDLLRLETDAGRRAQLLSIYSNNVRKWTRGEHYALFDVFAAANGVETVESVAADVAGTLEGFGPAPRRFVQPQLPAGIPLDPTSVTLHQLDPGVAELASHALPSQMWCITSNQWSRSTRYPSCADWYADIIYTDPLMISTAADLQVAYWMARTAGVIDASV